MRFVADAMLGKLARWLRLSGYDVYYSKSAKDEELLKAAESEARVLLTRDAKLVKKAGRRGINVVMIKSNSIEKQLLQLKRELGVRYEKTPSKALCPRCNGALEEVDRGEIAGEVPSGVLEAHREFYRCSQCGKVYWHGKHWRSIAKRVGEIEDDVPPPG